MVKTAIISVALLGLAIVPSQANTISFSYSGENTGKSSEHFDDQIINIGSGTTFTVPSGQDDAITISGSYSGFNGQGAAFQSIDLNEVGHSKDISIPFSGGSIGTYIAVLGPGTYSLDFSGTVKSDTDFSVSGIIDPSPTPAPVSWVLFASGLAFLGLWRATCRLRAGRGLASSAAC